MPLHGKMRPDGRLADTLCSKQRACLLKCSMGFRHETVVRLICLVSMRPSSTRNCRTNLDHQRIGQRSPASRVSSCWASNGLSKRLCFHLTRCFLSVTQGFQSYQPDQSSPGFLAWIQVMGLTDRGVDLQPSPTTIGWDFSESLGISCLSMLFRFCPRPTERFRSGPSCPMSASAKTTPGVLDSLGAFMGSAEPLTSNLFPHELISCDFRRF